MKRIVLLLLLSVIQFTYAQTTYDANNSGNASVNSEFSHITCGASIKLHSAISNANTAYRLHSLNVAYGTGSRQQSVTGCSEAGEANSFFTVFLPADQACSTNQPIACNSVIRLQHSASGKWLVSSAEHKSPLSGRHEVSAASIDESDLVSKNVNLSLWRVECVAKGSKSWQRGQPIRLRNVESKALLVMSPGHEYRQVIAGHKEVSAAPSSGAGSVSETSIETQWIAKEGLYYQVNE